MKMSCQLNGDDLDAICGIVGVFFWKTSHTVSQKTSSTLLQFYLLPLIMGRLSIKLIILCILLKSLSKRGGKKLIHTKSCRGMATWLKRFLKCKQPQI